MQWMRFFVTGCPSAFQKDVQIWYYKHNGKSQTEEEGVTWGYFAGTTLKVRPNNVVLLAHRSQKTFWCFGLHVQNIKFLSLTLQLL